MFFGFFIAPTSELIETEGSHIRTILDYPDKFGYTKTELIKIYEKYNEKLGVEGKAREEILSSLIKKGWIRIREYTSPRIYWSVQINRLTKKTEELLYKFANMVKDKKISRSGSIYDEIKISILYNNDLKELSIEDILSGKLFNMIENKRKKHEYLEQTNIKTYSPYLKFIKVKEYKVPRFQLK